MKQEHRLVAEIYRWIAPFVDAKCEMYLSPDGQAVRTAVQAGRFFDAGIPDLWFTLIGAKKPTLIEAKVIDNDGKVLLMPSQFQAWCKTGSGRYKPHCWVATERQFEHFYFWLHEDFAELHARSDVKRQTHIKPPSTRLEFSSPAELALHVLRACS